MASDADGADDIGVGPGAPAPFLTPGTGIDESLLTEAEYAVASQVIGHVASTLDGIALHVEIFLPEGEGPWPTILEASPYNAQAANGEVRTSSALIDYYVPRGYAVVHSHVRGTGNSEGCMDMMGSKERHDQYDTVQWIANQTWSDGKVAMHGFSYVGTTPNEALVMAPPNLVTVVAGAGVTNQWRNTYQNGVPYQGRSYPITYNAFAVAPPTDVERGPAWAQNAAAALCGQEEAIEAMSPGVYEKGVYTDYWADRDQTRFAADAKASILYLQGFTDRAVNPMEAVHWFNELPVPKKALLHQAGHTWPPRDDYKTIEHAWLDHWLKGIDNGIMDTPPVEILLNTDEVRVADAWPEPDATVQTLFLAPGTLAAAAPADGEETYTADMFRNTSCFEPMGPVAPVYGAVFGTNRLDYQTDALDDRLHLGGSVVFHLEASVDAENTYFLSDLYDVTPEGRMEWIAEGWMNAHLWAGFDKSTPLEPGERTTFRFAFEPRDYVLEPGHRLHLAIHGHDCGVLPFDEHLTHNTVHYGQDGSRLEIPVITDPVLFSRPENV